MQIKMLQKEMDILRLEKLRAGIEARLEKVIRYKELSLLIDRVDVKSAEELRNMADEYKNRLKNGLVLLAGTDEQGKIMLTAMRTGEEAIQKLHAGKLIKAVSERLDGKGGGRPDMAQGGGKNIAALEEVLKNVPDIVKSILGEEDDHA